MVECNNDSESFNYSTSKTIGTGDTTSTLIQYARFETENNTDGTMITDSDI